MPNPYTLHRQRRKSQKQKVSVTSQRVRLHSGGRRIRIVANRPIEEPTPTGTKPIEPEKALIEEPDKKKSKKSKRNDQQKQDEAE